MARAEAAAAGQPAPVYGSRLDQPWMPNAAVRLIRSALSAADDVRDGETVGGSSRRPCRSMSPARLSGTAVGQPAAHRRRFRRTYGFERGTPIDRHYLHRVPVGASRSDHGRRRSKCRPARIRSASGATCGGRTPSISCRHSRQPTSATSSHCEEIIPSASYDCLLLPNTLPHLRELDRALAQPLRIVRPGGVILASAGGPAAADRRRARLLAADAGRLAATAVALPGPARPSTSAATATASPRSRRSSASRSRS